ncbi:alpha/beta fold hydrolase [Solimonas sp. K1W22B-7]|uniref:YheT family hydrolase n=1 Tax=Solimonas sp. K1W22B-7 TaxID=2303331 RepID=UPI000E337268|nr:alpha/beta fold hydrolase [Solimonas sp. K1W22B-7]AXQ28968.1 alpha/beta fold hydrolase [Solimonas sp. K1W22B-7]
MSDAGFRPPLLIRHAQLQSLLATKSPRRKLWLKRGSRMEAVATRHELDCGDGVRLAGFHSRQPAEQASRGLALLIHGWEGSQDSSYLYSMACTLYAAGYNVFRLNLRDHGGTHHLNREPFHSARIDEVLGAARAAQQLDGDERLFVVGFSLGGNFALRIGLRGPAAGVNPQLSIGISPAIHPGSTLEAIEYGPLMFRLYFLDKWRKTLRAKKAAWPEHDFSAYPGIRSFTESTRRFVADFTDYPSMDDYLAAYTLTPEMLLASPSPVAVLTAKDDPVIPYRYFEGLRAEGSVRAFLATEHGGHCGFIEDLRLRSWAEARVLELFEAAGR